MADSDFESFFHERQVNLGECMSGNHRWSTWFTSEKGLTQECKSCHAINFEWKGDFGEKNGFRIRNDNLWINKRGGGTEWVRKRLKELAMH